MAEMECDESRWPVVVLTPSREPVDAKGFEEHCRKMFSYFDRGQSFGIVLDVRNSEPLTADRRRLVAEFSDRRIAQHPNVRMVMAIVVASSIQRGVVKAVNWLMRQPVPTEVVGTVEEGIRWCQRALAADTRRRVAL